MALLGMLLLSLCAAAAYGVTRRRSASHSHGAVGSLLAIVVIFAVTAVVLASLRESYWNLYGVMQPPEGAALRGWLAFTRGILVSAPLVATVVTVYAAVQKVRWAVWALFVFAALDCFWLYAVVVGKATGVAG